MSRNHRNPFAIYKAAGILPFALHEGRALILLGSEPRKRSEAQRGPHGSVWWLAFGGKIEPHDEGNPQRTALREYREESGHALGEPHMLARPLWEPRAKYLLFCARIPHQEQLPRFSDADARVDATLNKRELRWLDADTALAGLTATGIRYGDEFLPIKPWFAAFLHRERDTLRNISAQLA